MDQSQGTLNPQTIISLHDLVLDSADVREFLSGLAAVAAQILSRPDNEVFCGVTLLRPRSKATVASSSIQALEMDEVQYAFDDGPCLRSARENAIYVIADFRDEPRFSGYPAAILESGVRSAVAVPVPLEGEAKAALDFYAVEPNTFDATAIAAARAFADQASKSLRLAVRMADLNDRAGQLQAAMASRTTINLAAGAIMAQNRCSHDDAMRILKKASSSRNIKLHDLAASMVASIAEGNVETHFE
ncbi:MAG: response regulator receiver protein [Micrococcaceae bacterium]|nr:response regulator receiver protein [Micrococcaceae bacterium]